MITKKNDILKLTKLGFIYCEKVITFFFPLKFYEDSFNLANKIKNSTLSEYYQEICNSPFNFELTPEIKKIIEK